MTQGDAGAVGDSVREGRPWWQICCLGCLMILVAAVVGGFLLLQGVAGPGIERLAKLPSNYPADLQPYRLGDAASISYLQGKSKGKIREIVFAPVQLVEKFLTGAKEKTEGGEGDASRAFTSLGEDIKKTDTVTIVWKDLRADRDEVLAYYKQLFQKAGMTMQLEHEDNEPTYLLTGLRVGNYVQVNIEDAPDVSGIDGIIVAVTYSNQK